MTERVLDLDAAAAARAEARGEPPQVRFRGKLWDLPHELPAEYGWALLENDTKRAMKLLFVERFTAFWKLGPSRDDLVALVNAVPRLYGISTPGESPASPSSSETDGSRSRPPSRTTTTSTSEKQSGALTGAASG